MLSVLLLLVLLLLIRGEGGGLIEMIMYVRTTNLDDKENLHRVYGTYIPFSSSPFPLLG